MDVRVILPEETIFTTPSSYRCVGVQIVANVNILDRLQHGADDVDRHADPVQGEVGRFLRSGGRTAGAGDADRNVAGFDRAAAAARGDARVRRRGNRGVRHIRLARVHTRAESAVRCRNLGVRIGGVAIRDIDRPGLYVRAGDVHLRGEGPRGVGVDDGYADTDIGHIDIALIESGISLAHAVDGNIYRARHIEARARGARGDLRAHGRGRGIGLYADERNAAGGSRSFVAADISRGRVDRVFVVRPGFVERRRHGNGVRDDRTAADDRILNRIVARVTPRSQRW